MILKNGNATAWIHCLFTIFIKTSKPKCFRYPKNLKTIGDHLRARRLDLGLDQTEVANALNVEATTILNWELNRNPPSTKYRQKILDFLGADSSFTPDDIQLGIKLKEYRKANYLSQVQLSEIIGIKQSMISDIESSRHRILRKTREKILRFLATYET